MSKKVVSLKKRISVTIGALVFIIMSVMTTIIFYRSSDIITKISSMNENNLAQNSSQVIGGIFNHAFDVAHDLAHTFKVLKDKGVEREFLSSILKETIAKNPEFIGISTGWEPDAFDSKDSEYIGKPGHDNTGRVLFYCTTAGGLHIEPLVDYEEENSYYDIPRKTLKPHITEPYFYNIGGKDHYMVSAMVPIVIDNVFSGVIGVDFTLERINQMVGKMKPFDVGFAFLCSNKGAVVAHPNSSFVGKSLVEVHSEQGKESQIRIAKGEAFSYQKMSVHNNMESSYTFVPVKFHKVSTPWSFAVSVPMDKIMEGPRSLRNYSIVIGLLGIVFIVLLVMFFANRTFKPIIVLKDFMKASAEGEADMTRRMEVGDMDEIGETAYWFNVFIERIQQLILQVKGNSQTVSAAAIQISSSTEELSKTVDDQNIQAQSAATALSQLTTSSTDIATSMEESREISEGSSKMTAEGSKIIEKSIASLKEIESQTGNLSKVIDDLEGSTDKIGSIVNVINDVADQTNLLALNAAIEAARAGEHGRGFAVVADEVRKLAERTGKATNEIVSIINSLQEKSGDATVAMQETNSEVNRGRELGQDSLEILNKIVQSGLEVQKSAEVVSSAIEEENATIMEISMNIESMAAGSMESATAVQQVTQTAEDLAQEAEKLKDLVEQFVTQ